MTEDDTLADLAAYESERLTRKEFIAWFAENCESEVRRKILGDVLKLQLVGFVHADSSFHHVYDNLFMNTRPRKERTCFWEVCCDYVSYLRRIGHGWYCLMSWVNVALDTPSQQGTVRSALAQGLMDGDVLAEAVFEDMSENMSLVLGRKKAKCSGPALAMLSDYADHVSWYTPRKP